MSEAFINEALFLLLELLSLSLSHVAATECFPNQAEYVIVKNHCCCKRPFAYTA